MSDPRIVAFHAANEKILSHLHTEFSKLQTGRANAAQVETVMVDAYGQRQELRAVAGISIPESRSILIQPWDKSIMGAVEKALQQSNLGANPVNDGVAIRINFPPMNEERRMQLVKVVSRMAEDSRIAVRQARQEAHDSIKQEKDEDLKETLLDYLQKAVDEANAKIAESSLKKEEEIMKV
ncbi:MAG: ribosome recycling factor [Candidatus Peribacteria bacterium]|nr:ribosome recycling factor [Candidatus Peribacteria bacterium]